MESLYIIVVSILAAIATYGISVYMKKGAVFGSAVVTLVSGIVFPYFFPALGTKMAIMAACSSYGGMVAVKYVPRLGEMAAVGFIMGIIYIITENAYVGIGGRLGTIAAIACFTWFGIKRVYAMLGSSESQEQAQDTSLS